MNYAGGVGSRERIGHLNRISCGDVSGQSAGRNDLVESLAGDILHHHIVQPVLRTNIVHDADVGVLQAGDNLRLMREPGMEVRV